MKTLQRKNISFAVILFLTMLLVSCKDENIPQIPTLSISDTYAAYTAFDSASYWVYERKLPEAATDTLAVYQVWNDRRYHYDATTTGYYYFSHELFFNSSMIGITKGEIAVGTDADSIEMNGHYRIYFENERYFSIFIPRYPLGEVQLLGINEGNYTNVTLFPNLTVNGRNYQQVYHTSIVDYKNAPDTAYYHFYLAKDHGLIKYERRNVLNQPVELWELLSDKLIPLER